MMQTAVTADTLSPWRPWSSWETVMSWEKLSPSFLVIRNSSAWPLCAFLLCSLALCYPALFVDLCKSGLPLSAYTKLPAPGGHVILPLGATAALSYDILILSMLCACSTSQGICQNDVSEVHWLWQSCKGPPQAQIHHPLQTWAHWDWASALNQFLTWWCYLTVWYYLTQWYYTPLLFFLRDFYK